MSLLTAESAQSTFTVEPMTMTIPDTLIQTSARLS
jgi:hypothetical protein